MAGQNKAPLVLTRVVHEPQFVFWHWQESLKNQGYTMKWLQFFTPVKSMDAQAAQAYISDHPIEEITLLDVRQPSEYQDGHIPGAVLIPLPQLSDRLSELDPKKPTLVY